MGAISDGSSKIYVKRDDGTTIDIARENRLRGNAQHSWGVALAQGVPSLFMCLGSKIGESNSSPSGTDDGKNQSDTKEKQLEEKRNSILLTLNVDRNLSGDELVTKFNELQTEHTEKITQIQNETANKIDPINAEITALSNEIAKLDTVTDKATIEETQKKIKLKQEEIKNLKTKAAEDIKKAQKEWNEKSKLMQEVLEIDRQLADIADGGVGKATGNLKKFNKAADKFRKNYMKGGTVSQKATEAAKELKKAYEDFGAETPSSVTSLWNLYKDEVEQIIKQKETPAS